MQQIKLLCPASLVVEMQYPTTQYGGRSYLAAVTVSGWVGEIRHSMHIAQQKIGTLALK